MKENAVRKKEIARQQLIALFGVPLTAYFLLLPAAARAQGILPECFGANVEQSYAGVVACVESVGRVALSWVFAIALIFLMLTGYLYVTSMGNKQTAETAKNSFIFITIGILVVLGAYLIVNTLSTYFIR